MSTARPRRAGAAPWLAATALFAFAAVAVALISQHRYGMEPCPWCVLQRVLFLLIGVLALLGLAARAPLAARLSGGLVLVVAAIGFAASMWQHFVASRAESCNLTLADKLMNGSHLNEWLPDVFEARASCADAAVNLLGVPYDFWAAAIFIACAVTGVRALLRARRAG